MDDAASQYRQLPAVHRIVDELYDRGRVNGVPRPLAVEAARDVVEEQRQRIAAGAETAASLDDLVERVVARLAHGDRPPLGSIINATGIIIHTGLGRAPLAAPAVDAVADVAAHYAPVELDLDSGERGRRTELVRDLLCRLTGAESATVVNNNAAALLLVLAAVARDRHVVVSRGELIEIGGSFRLPEIMQTGGARLREVGTTNRTRAGDYERAIDETTAALLKVHTSNFRVEGFTEAVAIGDLVELGRRHGVPVIHDIGSGLLRPWPGRTPLASEPDATTSVAAGADVVLFSGDKLLGGPQAGILVGRRAMIDRLERHPLMRAMRVDKITLAALGATLQVHRDHEEAARRIPVLELTATPVETLRDRAATIRAALHDIGGAASVAIAETSSYLGGGSLPAQAMPSVAVVVRPAAQSEEQLAARLRRGAPAVLPRVRDGAIWLDRRAVMAGQDAALVEAVRAALEPAG